MTGPVLKDRTSTEAAATTDPGRTLPLPLRAIWRTVYWTYERTTIPYDLMVIAILAFVWLTPPDWLGDPTARGMGVIGWLLNTGP